MKTCPKCGAEFSDEVIYCRNCGTKVNQSIEAASEEAQPQLPVNGENEAKAAPEDASEPAPEPAAEGDAALVKEPAAEAAPAEASAAATETPKAESAPEKAPAKKKKFPVVPVAIGGAALVAVAAVAGVAVNNLVVKPSKAYDAAVAAYESAEYEAAASQFEAMGDYKDSKDRAAECVTLMHYENGKRAFNDGDFDKAAEEFTAAGSYKDSAEMVKECVPASHYAKAMLLSSYGDKEKAVDELILAGDYKDSKRMIYNILVELGDKALEEKDFVKASDHYQNAKTYVDYTDEDKEKVIRYGTAIKTFNEKNYKEAIRLFSKCNRYEESERYIAECYYQLGEEAYEKGNLQDAANYYGKTGEYVRKGYDKRKKVFYELGVKALEKKDYDKAADYLKAAGSYEDAPEKGKEAFYFKGNKLFAEKDYGAAAEFFNLAGNFKDAKTKFKECSYQSGIYDITQKNFKNAKLWFEDIGNYKYTQDLVRICDAELAYEDEQISKAASLYAKVSKKLKISGFDVQGRKAAITAESAFAKVSGSWKATSNNTYVKYTQKTRRYKKWKKYYLTKLKDWQSLDISYTVNEDGTFNLDVSAEFYRFMNFAWSLNDVETDYMKVEKEFKNLKKMPSKFNMGSGVTIKYSKGKFTLVFSKKVKSGSSTTQYKATVKFKKG
ncbi:MAG: hypothetical protein J5623_04315 [Clostridiales bacterium]|nr:hypothetical protein [Clostridiales bacterium]